MTRLGSVHIYTESFRERRPPRGAQFGLAAAAVSKLRRAVRSGAPTPAAGRAARPPPPEATLALHSVSSQSCSAGQGAVPSSGPGPCPATFTPPLTRSVGLPRVRGGGAAAATARPGRSTPTGRRPVGRLCS